MPPGRRVRGRERLGDQPGQSDPARRDVPGRKVAGHPPQPRPVAPGREGLPALEGGRRRALPNARHARRGERGRDGHPGLRAPGGVPEQRSRRQSRGRPDLRSRQGRLRETPERPARRRADGRRGVGQPRRRRRAAGDDGLAAGFPRPEVPPARRSRQGDRRPGAPRLPLLLFPGPARRPGVGKRLPGGVVGRRAKGPPTAGSFSRITR